VDRVKIIQQLNRLAHTDIDLLIAAVPGASNQDTPTLPTAKRIANLFAFAESGNGSGLPLVYQTARDLFPKLFSDGSPEPGIPPELLTNLPHERNRFFTGRDAELTALRDTLSAHRNAALIQAIRGLGGMGKTQVAIEYAFRCKEHEAGYPAYDYILWTRAEAITDLLAGYANIAALLSLPLTNFGDQEQIALEVCRWLEQNGNWLLIYDNADTPDLLEPFRPRNAAGHILLTSRAHAFRGNLGILHPIQLKSLLPEDAARFLFTRTGHKLEEASQPERNTVTNLARELGYFPLALEQAAAYINAQGQRFDTYLAAFRRKEQPFLNAALPETGDYRDEDKQEYKTVRTTWHLNFQVVEAKHKASAELLRFSAFIAPDDIPQELVVLGAEALGPPLAAVFANLPQEEIEDAYDKLLVPLLRYSLIEKNVEARTFSVHRMVQSVQRDRLQKQQAKWAKRTVDAVCGAFPNAEFTNWEQCARLLPHALACLPFARNAQMETQEMGLLCNRAGYYLNERGLYADAEPLYVEALEVYRKALPQGHPSIASSLNNLAVLYKSQGRNEEAKALYVEALEMRRKALPQGHPDIATSLNNLAVLYDSQGRYEQAERLYVEALAIIVKALGPQHPTTKIVLNNVVLFLRQHGKTEEADALLRDQSDQT